MNTETQTKASSTKISEALELLNEAAKEKKDELKNLMVNKYAHIKEAMNAEVDQGKAALQQTKDMAQKVMVEGKEKVKEIAGHADKCVRQDPWSYIAGTAAVAILLGYIMGSKRR
ncbi:MAG: DUF883 family protein [Candidatus Omnitrophica bacterium]|nr:DUF883 family protein [Candidatus Omnitrophota bacterium]